MRARRLGRTVAISAGWLWVTGVLLGLPDAQAGGLQDQGGDVAVEARKLIAHWQEQIRPLEIAVNRAWWQANISGRDEDFQAKMDAENRLNQALADRAYFRRVAPLRGKTGDRLLDRQLEVIYLACLPRQVDPQLLQEMTALQNRIEQAFNVYRARVGDRVYTDSQVRDILAHSRDPALRRAVWEASKAVGKVVEQDLLRLVRLRNRAARQLGFRNYHHLELAVQEHQPEELFALFDRLDRLTADLFVRVKGEMDRRLARMYGISVQELRPWHYHDPFFQEAPAVYEVDLDAPLRNVDIIDLCRRFYAGIGLPVDDVLQRSDLFEKPGKSPHAFCTDIDRQGDVRVLANVVPNHYWLSTLLHELGHAVYSSKYIPESIPYLLRSEAHILTTEGVAMMFERLGKSARWLQGMGVALEDPDGYEQAAARMRRDELLVFSRWCQVMLRFEAALYDNPDQDLNRLWWDLVERYQGVRRPEGRNHPDYASKIHIVSAPVYYHNYMLGELFACQLHAAIVRQVLHQDNPARAVYLDNPEVGRFLRQRVFAPGRTLSWNELTRQATGADLGPDAFAQELKAVP